MPDSFANYGGAPAKAEYSHEGVSRHALDSRYQIAKLTTKQCRHRHSGLF